MNLGVYFNRSSAVLHLPDALLRYGCVLFFSAWSYERLHQITKRVATNNISLDLSVMKNSVALFKRGVARLLHAESASGQSAADDEKRQRAYGAQQFHGEPHPQLLNPDPLWQRRIDVGMLPEECEMQWPVKLGRSRTIKIADTDFDAIAQLFTERSAELECRTAPYRTPGEQISDAIKVR